MERTHVRLIADQFVVFSMDKQWTFARNMGIAMGASVVGGIVGAELSDIVNATPSVIAASSTLGQYLLWFGAFIPLHIQDNQDIYWKGQFLWKPFAHDMMKMITGCALLDAVYLCARPCVNYYFQEKGCSITEASLLSDLVCIPAYTVVALPVMKSMGVVHD